MTRAGQAGGTSRWRFQKGAGSPKPGTGATRSPTITNCLPIVAAITCYGISGLLLGTSSTRVEVTTFGPDGNSIVSYGPDESVLALAFGFVQRSTGKIVESDTAALNGDHPRDSEWED
jgi:hypothetical protein